MKTLAALVVLSFILAYIGLTGGVIAGFDWVWVGSLYALCIWAAARPMKAKVTA